MTNEELRVMMRDPRYWRTREPDFVKRVTDGVRALAKSGQIETAPRPMTNYRVTWQIDIEADSPKEAAAKALVIMRDPSSIATVFDVTHTRTRLRWGGPPHEVTETVTQVIDLSEDKSG